MKYAAVVLFNNRNSLAAVDFGPAADALLSGGVFLDELSFVRYDDADALFSKLFRLQAECDGIIVISSAVLIETAKEVIGHAADSTFSEEYVLETKSCLFGVVTADMGGAKIVSEQIIPRLDKRRGQSFSRVILRTVGAPSELLFQALEGARAVGDGPVLHCTEKYGAARIELIYDRTTPKYAVDEAARTLMETLGEYVYATEDVSIAERLVEALKIRRRRISVAESFTGGGVGRAIVRVPGASAVYFEGLNTYNARSKEERLGVTAFTVKHRGTVSEETAYEMALGLLKSGNCDLAVATTGVAGPDPDEKGNPVGLCYFAVGTQEKVDMYRYRLGGDRENITETAINLALFLSFRALK